jgi:hypothetical protein
MAASLARGPDQQNDQASQDLILAMRLQQEGSRPSSASSNSPYVHHHPSSSHGHGHHGHGAGRGRGRIDETTLEAALAALSIGDIDERTLARLLQSPYAVRSSGGRGRGIVSLGITGPPIQFGGDMSFEVRALCLACVYDSLDS